MNKSILFTKRALAATIAASVVITAGCSSDSGNLFVPANDIEGVISSTSYEIWASDQSNSVAGAATGLVGSYIWVWDSADVDTQLAGGVDAMPLSCDGNNTVGLIIKARYTFRL